MDITMRRSRTVLSGPIKDGVRALNVVRPPGTVAPETAGVHGRDRAGILTIDVSFPETEPPNTEAAAPTRRSAVRRYSVSVRRGILVTIALAIGAMLFLYFTRPGLQDFSTPIRNASASLPKQMEAGNAIGSDTAPLTLTVFEDFQCPFCLKFSASQEPALIQEYVQTGKLKIVHLNLIRLGSESTQAALASMCAADQSKYWDYYDRLYLVEAEANQYPNEKTNVGRFTNDKLKGYASDVGLDRQQFDACLDSSQHADTISADQRAASSAGVTGTPGFILSGHPSFVGAPSTMADWRKLLDTALAASPK